MSEERTTCICHQPIYLVLNNGKLYLSDDPDGTIVGRNIIELPNCFVDMITPKDKKGFIHRIKNISGLGKFLSREYNE